MRPATEVRRLANRFRQMAFSRRTLADVVATNVLAEKLPNCKESTREKMATFAARDVLLCGIKGFDVGVDLKRRGLAQMLRIARESARRRAVLVELDTDLEEPFIVRIAD